MRVGYREALKVKNKDLQREVTRLADEFLYEDKDTFNKLNEIDQRSLVAAVIDATDPLDRHCWLTENDDLDTTIYLFTKALKSCSKEDEKDFFDHVKEMACTYHKNFIDDLLEERNQIS